MGISVQLRYSVAPIHPRSILSNLRVCRIPPTAKAVGFLLASLRTLSTRRPDCRWEIRSPRHWDPELSESASPSAPEQPASVPASPTVASTRRRGQGLETRVRMWSFHSHPLQSRLVYETRTVASMTVPDCLLHYTSHVEVRDGSFPQTLVTASG